MLRSFRLANHKSFRDEAELLLVPAYDKSRPAVPVAGIFGANASGKSNLLDALGWLQRAVLDSYRVWSPGAGVPRQPFRIDPELSARRSGFCVSLVIDGLPYTYGVEVDDDEIVEEWLHTYPHNRRRRVFDRWRREIRLGSTVPDYRARGSFLGKNTRGNALFLTVAAHNDLAEVEPVFRWFQDRLIFSSEETESVDNELTDRLLGPDRDRIVALLRAADLGIADVAVEPGVGLPADVARRLARTNGPEGDSASVELATGSGKSEAAAMLAARGSSARYFIARPQVSSAPVLIFHHGRGGGALRIEDESAGTRSWLRLISRAMRVLEHGGLLVVDEVDSSLHPHLTGRLIQLFRDDETNPLHAQLLFTSHDATLLDDQVLARDEIWFVEKEPDSGATTLYPLTDFHPRKNENIEGRYLAGGYGAVPLLTHIQFREAVSKESGAGAAA